MDGNHLPSEAVDELSQYTNPSSIHDFEQRKLLSYQDSTINNNNTEIVNNYQT